MKFKQLLYMGMGALLTWPAMIQLAYADNAQNPMIPQSERNFGMTPQEHYEEVMHEVMLDITIVGILVSLVAIYFLIVYKRKSPDDVGKQPKLSPQAVLGWVILPSAIFLADDFYLFAKGWDLHDHYRKVPANAYEIKVTGAMWSWTYDYPNGVQSMNELVVPQGQPVLLRMTSLDVIHSHYLNRYHVTEDTSPGRVTYQWFLPDKIEESVVTCREYCGMMHSGMYGKVKVVSRPEFDQWLSAQAAKAELNITKPDTVAAMDDRGAKTRVTVN